MRVRYAVAPVVLLLSAGCGSGGSPAAAPSPSPTPSPAATAPSPAPLSVADLKRAAADVRASGTAMYRYSLTVTAAGERVSSTHFAGVDFAARRQSGTITFDATPQLAAAMTRGGPSLDQLEMKIVADGDVVYLQMAGWPAPHKGKWLRLTKADLEQGGGVELAADSFATVPLLDVLARATTGTPRPVREIDLTVPVADVLASAPSRLVQSLAGMGVDLEQLSGSVVATAWLEAGLPVVQIELVNEVKRLVAGTGRPSAFANAITSLVVKMAVTSTGVPSDITPPPAHLVMTPEEMAAATG